MRKPYVVMAAVVIALLVLGAATNPSEQDFTAWYEQHVKAEAAGTRGLSRLPAVLGGAARLFQARWTVRRQNFVILSLYRIRVLGEERTYLGAFGFFIEAG